MRGEGGEESEGESEGRGGEESEGERGEVRIYM